MLETVNWRRVRLLEKGTVINCNSLANARFLVPL